MAQTDGAHPKGLGAQHVKGQQLGRASFIPAPHVLGQAETWTEPLPQSAQVSPGDLIPCPRGHRGLHAAWVGVRRGRHGPMTLKEAWDERMGPGIGRLRERSRVGIGPLLVSPAAQSPGASGPLGTMGSAPHIKWRDLGSCFLMRLLQVPAICSCHSSFITGDLYIRVTWKCLRQQCSGPSPTDSYLIGLGLGQSIFFVFVFLMFPREF